MKPPILCYHQVAPLQEVGRRLNVEPARLDSHISFFKRRGCLFVAACELSDAEDKAVCLTFDDSYNSTLTYGQEVLKARAVSATFYAVPSQVGGASVWDGEDARPLANWDQLAEAQKAGFEIGNHTQTHARLSELSPDDQLAEWRSAHRTLADHGIEAQTACYPYGVCSDPSLQAFRELGYSAALSIDKWPGKDDPFRQARIVVAFGDALPMLLYKLYLRPHLP